MNAPNTTTAIQKPQAPSKVAEFRDYLEVRKKALGAIIPSHLNLDRVMRVALAAYSKTPKLMECSIDSVYQAVRQATELGLEPGGALGHAYLVPYKNQCTLIVGYRGLIDLARRSGEIATIEAHVVHERDVFTLKFGLDPVLDHEPFLDGDPGEMKFAYAVGKLRDGGTQCEVMTKAQVDRIRQGSQGRDATPWTQHYEEMARKTVVRRLVKYLPLSSEKARPLAEAVEHDEAIDLEVGSDGVATRAGSRTDAVLARARAVEEAEIAEPPAPDPKPSESDATP
jgi:recombination protein RecT